MADYPKNALEFERWLQLSRPAGTRLRGKLFYRLMQQAVAVEPVTGGQITGDSSPSQHTIYGTYESEVHSPKKKYKVDTHNIEYWEQELCGYSLPE